MKQSKEQLLELIRCGLWDTVPNIALFEQGVNWKEIFRLAQEQTVSGVISVAIEKLPLTVRPPRVEALRLHQAISLNRQYRAYQTVVLGKVLEILREAGVERPVLLKGLGVGFNYPDPTLRQCGDLDIYVGKELYSKVWSYLSERYEGVEKEEDNMSDQHFHFEFMDTQIEIHKYATAPNSVVYHSNEFMQWVVAQLEGDNLREVTMEGVKVYLPPCDFDFIFIFYHSWRHFLNGGIGLRQLCDWCCHINTFYDKLDTAELAQFVKRFKLQTPISIFATIAVKSLGLPEDKFSGIVSTSHKKYISVLDKIWEGGNFGFYHERRKKRSKTVFERKCRSFKAQIQYMIFLIGIDAAYSIRYYIPAFGRSFRIAFKKRKELNDKI
ncbi:MAG: nucleotidyltransferase family protein [Rikenellaceae bacterium]